MLKLCKNNQKYTEANQSGGIHEIYQEIEVKGGTLVQIIHSKL